MSNTDDSPAEETPVGEEVGPEVTELSALEASETAATEPAPEVSTETPAAAPESPTPAAQASAASVVAQPEAPRRWSRDERQASLAQAVAVQVRKGWNVQSQTDYQAVLVKEGTKVNHLLHLILTLITLGLWVIVWVGVTLAHKREKHAVIDVDEFGNVRIQT